jgi:5-methylcytosine-specific restriction endonuclease McrA
VKELTPEVEEQLRAVFKRRFKNIERWCSDLGVSPPRGETREEIWKLLVESWRRGFKCEYCGEEMLIHDPKEGHPRSVSLDHRIPIRPWGGSVYDPSNIAVVCHRCNIVKGTIKAGTFTEILRLCETVPGLKERFLEEAFRGRLADKIERLKLEKEIRRLKEELKKGSDENLEDQT